jgi:stearoyl-CoA desaturase (delta-9 desaturase)
MEHIRTPRNRWGKYFLIWISLAIAVYLLGLSDGQIDLPWWGYGLIALGLTHVTIASVTIFLHRHQAHHALHLHPIASHFFRCWLWLTTGTNTKEWVSVHRKHHAKCETVDDPHSPQIYGLSRVVWQGTLLYARAAADQKTLAQYGRGTPDDWIEHNVYAKHALLGLTLMGLADVILFGFVPGGLILLAQIVWIPFWAAGIVNGVGHYHGYRNFTSPDSSTNIVPWGIVIGGEELHNNHHAYPSSAQLSNKWYEFDLGWAYIRVMQLLGLAHRLRVSPKRFHVKGKTLSDTETLHAVLALRYHVIEAFDRAVRGVKRRSQDAKDDLYEMRRELSGLWEDKKATYGELTLRLESFCAKARVSAHPELREFGGSWLPSLSVRR